MAETPSSETKLAERAAEDELIQRALRRAVREALLGHKQAGNPIAVWRDGRVVWLAPDEIPIEDED